MGNNHYARGAAFERKVKEYLEVAGYYAVRAAGSHGLTDIIAVHPMTYRKRNKNGKTLFIQCKTGKATMSKKDRNSLYDLATQYGATPLLAQPDGSSIIFYEINPDGNLGQEFYFGR